jgi:DNA-binding transcriptional regulator YhcF (GntR family)
VDRLLLDRSFLWTPRSGAKDHHEEQVLVERIRQVLEREPRLSARSIASKVGCSPTTTARWKAAIEREGLQEQEASSWECVND